MNGPPPATRSALLVATAGLAVVLVILGMALSSAGWNPTVFVGFGEDAKETSEYGTERLGEVMLRPSQGHDGKYFFVQANDPLVLEPADNAEILDLPVYRSQRMLYPFLAGGGGLFEPPAVVWGLLIVNIAAMVFGTYCTARLAQCLGGSAWWGLAFTGNIGLLYSLTSDGSDVVAAAAAAWAVLSIYKARPVSVVAGLTLATLSKEVMLVTVVGCCVWLWLSNRRLFAVLAGVIPAAALVAWSGYVRVQLGADDVGANAIGLPLAGLFRAIPDWLAEPVVLAAGLGVLLLLGLFTYRWLRLRTALGWAYIGFVPLATVMTDKVWHEVFDFTRALAPALTAAVLVVFVEARRTQSSAPTSSRVGAE